MSLMHVTESAAVGFEGATVWLQRGKEYPADHPLVTSFPQFFAGDPENEPESAPVARAERGRRVTR